jgi:hypothetical protein
MTQDKRPELGIANGGEKRFEHLEVRPLVPEGKRKMPLPVVAFRRHACGDCAFFPPAIGACGFRRPGGADAPEAGFAHGQAEALDKEMVANGIHAEEKREVEKRLRLLKND